MRRSSEAPLRGLEKDFEGAVRAKMQKSDQTGKKIAFSLLSNETFSRLGVESEMMKEE